MDTQRFDDLARAVAGGRSRRGLMRGLSGAAALWGSGRLIGASAHHAKAGPGDPCRTDSQCVAADAPMICANNGFSVDGSLNCCTYEGSRCGSDAWCCWDNVCINGVCTSTSTISGPGDPCTDSSQCMAADTSVTCDYVATTNDYRCCTYYGGRCGTDAGCCGNLACFNGFCSSQGDIAGPGEPCVDSSQCVAADTAVICDYTLATGDYRCCANIGGRCSWDGGCCSSAICDSGACIGNYVGPGDPCQDSSQCLAADTSVTCDYIGQTDDFRCCADEGGRCGWDGGCCGWMRCGDDGFCTGVPPTGCDGEGCTCDYGAPGSCADGLYCCASERGFVCGTAETCGMG